MGEYIYTADALLSLCSLSAFSLKEYKIYNNGAFNISQGGIKRAAYEKTAAGLPNSSPGPHLKTFPVLASGREFAA